jgi:hypothetical protein
MTIWNSFKSMLPEGFQELPNYTSIPPNIGKYSLTWENPDQTLVCTFSPNLTLNFLDTHKHISLQKQYTNTLDLLNDIKNCNITENRLEFKNDNFEMYIKVFGDEKGNIELYTKGNWFFSEEWSEKLYNHIMQKFNSDFKPFLLHMFSWEMDKYYFEAYLNQQNNESVSQDITERYRNIYEKMKNFNIF